MQQRARLLSAEPAFVDAVATTSEFLYRVDADYHYTGDGDGGHVSQN